MTAFTTELNDSTFEVLTSEDEVFAAHAPDDNNPAFVECIADSECYKKIICQSHAHAIKIAVDLGLKCDSLDADAFAHWIEATYPKNVNHA